MIPYFRIEYPVINHRILLVKDIADGYFGQRVVPSAPSIIDQAVKVYRKLTEEDNDPVKKSV